MSSATVRVFAWQCVLAAVAEKVFFETSGGKARVVSSERGVLGDDGTMRGAGGWERMAEAKASGADALRTWHIEDIAETLAGAEQQGLKVSAGIWLTHDASRYQDCHNMDADEFWQKELKLFLDAVDKSKTSPGLLWWTVGNEIELEVSWTHGSECLWRRMEWVASAVKKADPDHPVGTVTNGLHEGKIGLLAKLCPSCDFLGINAYGEESLHVGANLKKFGWDKPFAITEYGPTGHWLLPITSWDAYIEETSTVKAKRYSDTCNYCRDEEKCIGSFAFFWGWKWEKTGTWYGLVNEWKDVTTGVSKDADCPDCRSEVVATLEKCWAGSTKASPPSITALQVNGERYTDTVFKVEPDTKVPLAIEATKTGKGRRLQTVWAMTEDNPSSAIGGAFESTVPLLEGIFPPSAAATTSLGLGMETTMDTSNLELGKQYRLYAFVRDSSPQSRGNRTNILAAGKPKEEAHASYAIHTCYDARPGDDCHTEIMTAMNDKSYAFRRPGVDQSSSLGEWQMMLHQIGGGSACAVPCAVKDGWCHTAQRGEECWGHVKWAKNVGFRRHPERYPGLHRWSSLEDFQYFFHTTPDLQGRGCTRPCIQRWGWMLR